MISCPTAPFNLNIMGYRSKVQSSTFRVKDKEGNKDPKSSLKVLIFPNNCQAPNFGIGCLTRLTLISQIRIPNAVQGGECNPWPRPGMPRCGGGKPIP
jgi:hypothetical protein